MPRIKRWAPRSHNLNRDPEFRELRRRFEDWMGFVWEEMFSIGDQNDGILDGKPNEIADSLAYISMRNRPSLAAKRITDAFNFMQDKGWIQIETDCIRIINHAKYHKARGDKKSEEGVSEGSPLPTILPSDLPEQPQKKVKKERATQLPPFREVYLTPALVRWSEEKGYRAPGDLVEAFEDYHRAKGSRFTDWEAAFRTWVRNDAKWNQNGATAPDDPWAAYGN